MLQVAVAKGVVQLSRRFVDVSACGSLVEQALHCSVGAQRRHWQLAEVSVANMRYSFLSKALVPSPFSS